MVDDEHLVLEHKNAGLSRRPLEAFVGLLGTLGRALPAARAAIPPPASMVDRVDDWEALARELDGALERARMIVSRRLGAHPASVATEWDADGAALRTLVGLRPARLPAAERLEWTGQPLLPGQLPEGLPRGVRRLLHELDADAMAVSVNARAATLVRPAPLEEPLSALGSLDVLGQLVGELRAGRGPYR